MEQVSAGVESRRGVVERQFERSPRMAKHDLAELGDRGLTSFAAKRGPGH